LREHSDFMDMRSRGASAIRVLDRPAPVNARGSFFSAFKASQALATLAELKDAFTRRLKRAQELGDEHESDCLAEEIGYLTESHRLLAMTLEGYEVY